MNMASSRSHCIFTISIEARVVGSDTVRRSKLHLVDLAGSERVAKTNSSGSVLNEAKYINTSLFYLEMVIVALYEKATKGRAHVPYRNSAMTSVLRDSLGGNCKTVMIATINPEAVHTEESLSTCKFAQRVSLIKNRATVNEDTDPNQVRVCIYACVRMHVFLNLSLTHSLTLTSQPTSSPQVIKRLKGELLGLREEIAYLKGEAGEGEALTPLALEELNMACRQYVDDADPQASINIGSMSLTKIKDAFAVLKNLVLEARSKAAATAAKGAPLVPPSVQMRCGGVRYARGGAYLLSRATLAAIVHHDCVSRVAALSCNGWSDSSGDEGACEWNLEHEDAAVGLCAHLVGVGVGSVTSSACFNSLGHRLPDPTQCPGRSVLSSHAVKKSADYLSLWKNLSSLSSDMDEPGNWRLVAGMHATWG